MRGFARICADLRGLRGLGLPRKSEIGKAESAGNLNLNLKKAINLRSKSLGHPQQCPQRHPYGHRIDVESPNGPPFDRLIYNSEFSSIFATKKSDTEIYFIRTDPPIWAAQLWAEHMQRLHMLEEAQRFGGLALHLGEVRKTIFYSHGPCIRGSTVCRQ